MIEHAITPAQVARKVIGVMERRIRALLDDRDFCPDSAAITRYERMPISAELLADLNGRYQECWLSWDELSGEPA